MSSLLFYFSNARSHLTGSWCFPLARVKRMQWLTNICDLNTMELLLDKFRHWVQQNHPLSGNLGQLLQRLQQKWKQCPKPSSATWSTPCTSDVLNASETNWGFLTRMVYLYNDIYCRDTPSWSETLEMEVTFCQRHSLWIEMGGLLNLRLSKSDLAAVFKFSVCGSWCFDKLRKLNTSVFSSFSPTDWNAWEKVVLNFFWSVNMITSGHKLSILRGRTFDTEHYLETEPTGSFHMPHEYK